MLTRKSADSSGMALPKDWVDEYQQIIDQAYSEQCKSKNSKIEVFGRLYQEELLIGFVLRGLQNSAQSPYSLLLSFDLDDPKQVVEIRKDSLDIGAQFIDQYFMNSEREYYPVWQKEEYKKKTFYYKITREDFILSIKADEILEKSSN